MLEMGSKQVDIVRELYPVLLCLCWDFLNFSNHLIVNRTL